MLSRIPDGVRGESCFANRACWLIISFAFLDFMTPQDATRSLTNRKNHYYAGRRLNVQVCLKSMLYDLELANV